MKHSISKQFTCIFVLITAGAFLLCWFINTLFMERFYISNKESELLDAYVFINEAAINEQFGDDEFIRQLQSRCARFNMDVLVIDVNSQTMTYAGNNPEATKLMLWDNLFLSKKTLENPSFTEKRNTLLETDNYQMKIVDDRRLQNQNIAMWGTLENGNIFMIRTALESIQDSVLLANRFLAQVGTLAIILTGITIWLISKKITKPILALAEISEKMSHLDFEAKYIGNDKNEISLLGKNINSMSEILKETISELKEANIELEKDIQKKEKIEEMRNEFLSNVSHELKTPIALIQGYAEGLQEGMVEDEEGREYYCNVICDEAAKMNMIVQKLLTLNQLEFGNDVLNMERFNITDMINNQIQLSSILLQQNGITISFNETRPVYVWGDAFQVGEVFANYLSNAIHYCEGDKRIDIQFEENEAEVKIVCFNTGKNIPDESIHLLWDKFYKVDKARTRTYGGSGVGLSIVKAIMESMGKGYGVTNYSDGVAFWFSLDKK